jgi:tRNA pseudouridine65 synthase
VPEPLPILYRDDELVVVSKPPGLLVHRTSTGSGEEALLQRLRDQLGRPVFPVQRLDRWTSGTIAYGLDPRAAQRLQRELKSPAAVKEYLALVRGLVRAPFESRAPLVDDHAVERDAWSEFRPLAPLAGHELTLVVARLHTGRYHQVRRHLSLAGHHVCGDPRYGKARLNRRLAAHHGLARPFLHAWRLVIPRGEGAPLALEAPLAPDLERVLVSLRGCRTGAKR